MSTGNGTTDMTARELAAGWRRYIETLGRIQQDRRGERRMQVVESST